MQRKQLLSIGDKEIVASSNFNFDRIWQNSSPDFSASTIGICRAESVFHDTLKTLARMLGKSKQAVTPDKRVPQTETIENERSASILPKLSHANKCF